MNFVSEGYWRAASEGDAFGPAGMRSPCAASPDAATAKMARARHERELALRLCEAAREGELEDVERFVACGVPLDFVDRKGDYSTPLIEAIQSRKLGPAAHLLAKGASPHLSGAQGWPPLAVAFLTKQAPMADLLLEAGADVKAPGAEGVTCLHIAAYLGWAEGLQRCLRTLEEGAARAHHAAAAAAGSPAGGAAGGAALAGLPSLTVRPPGEPLPLLKAALDATDAAGNTPHMLACLGGWHDLAAELRRHGAGHSASNRDGANALHLAAGGVRLWCQHPLLEAATRSHAPRRPHMLPPQPRMAELGVAGAAGTQPPQGPPRTPSALSAARRPGGVGGVAKASTPRSSDIARAILLTPRSRNRPGTGPSAGGATPSGGSASGGSGLRRLHPDGAAPPTSGGSGSAASASEGASFFASAVGSPLAAGAGSAAPAARERTPFGSPLAASAPRGPLSMASQPAAAGGLGQPPRPSASEGGKGMESVNPPLGMQAIHTAAPAGSPDGDVATASGGGGGGSPGAAGAGSAGQRAAGREEQPALLARDYTALLLALLPLEEPHLRMLQQPDRLGRLPHQVAVECLHAEAAGILLPAIAHRAKWLQRRAAAGLLGAASPGTGELTTPAHEAAHEGAPLRPAALGAWAFQQVSALAEDAWKLLTLPPPLREPVLEVEFAHGEEEAQASIAATRAILGSPLSAEAEEAAAQRLSGEQAAPASPRDEAAGGEGGHVHAGAGCDTPTPVVRAVFGRGAARPSTGPQDPVALAEAAAAGTARFAGQPWPDAALLQKDLQPVREVWLRHCARDAAVVGAALLEVAASCGSLHLNVAALDASVMACVHGTPGVTSPVPSAGPHATGTPESTGGSGVSGVVRAREDALAVLLAPVLNSLRTAAEAGGEGSGAAPAASGASPVEPGLPLTDVNSPTRVAISAIAKAWLRVAAWQRRVHVVACRARRA